VPVDFIGGTSIGSFIGGLYASEQSIEKVDPLAGQWATQASSLWFYLWGATLHAHHPLSPHTTYTQHTYTQISDYYYYYFIIIIKLILTLFNNTLSAHQISPSQSPPISTGMDSVRPYEECLGAERLKIFGSITIVLQPISQVTQKGFM
jgi:hypothetical protein